MLHKAKQSNEKFDASQLHDREKQKHKTEILPDDGTGDVEVENKVFDVFMLLICFCLGSQLNGGSSYTCLHSHFHHCLKY